MEKKNNLTIHLLAGTTALIQLAAGFALTSINKKNVIPPANQRIEYYTNDEDNIELKEAVSNIGTSYANVSMNLPTNTNIGDPYRPGDKNNPLYEAIHEHTIELANGSSDVFVKNDFTPPTKPDVRIRDPYDHRGPQLRIELNEHGEIITGNTNTNSEENSSMIEDIGELADMFSSNENMFMKNSVNLPTKSNIGEPYGPWDKDNPLYEAIHQHTQDIANAHSDENEVVKNSVNLPTQTRIGDPYEPGHGSNPLTDAIHARTLELAGIKENPVYNKIRENAPYMDELHKQQLYEMDPSLNPLNRPPYQAAAENIEEYNKSK